MSQSYKMTQNIKKFGVDKLLMKKIINCQVPSFEFWILMQKVRHLWRWSSDKKNIAHTCFTHKHILPFVPTKSEQQKRNKKKKQSILTTSGVHMHRYAFSLYRTGHVLNFFIIFSVHQDVHFFFV
jgi:hypothetical protein